MSTPCFLALNEMPEVPGMPETPRLPDPDEKTPYEDVEEEGV